MRTADILHTDTGVKFIWANTSTEMLRPELDWERIGTRRVGNPFVFYSEDHKEYRLYYSASSVHLEDSNIDEPIHLGLARADSPDGPWMDKDHEGASASGSRYQCPVNLSRFVISIFR